MRYIYYHEIYITKDGIVHIKNSFSGKSFKIHHMNVLHYIIPEFNFNDVTVMKVVPQI